MLSPTPTTAAEPEITKKRLPLPGIIAVVVGVSLMGIIIVANLDEAGKACQADGSIMAAIACYETMTSIESVIGVRSARLSHALTDLSICYSKQNRFQDAIRTQEKAIAMEKEIKGSENTAVLILTANLASYMSKAKNYAAADQLLKDTLSQAESVRPTPDYAIGFILNSLGDSYLAQNRFADAELVAKRLERVDTTLLSLGYYPFYGTETLAEIYAKTGRLAEAEVHARAALTKSNIADKTVLVPAHEMLGKILVLEGKLSEAKEQFDESMTLLVAKFGSSEKTKYWRARYDSYLKEKDPFKE